MSAPKRQVPDYALYEQLKREATYRARSSEEYERLIAEAARRAGI